MEPAVAKPWRLGDMLTAFLAGVFGFGVAAVVGAAVGATVQVLVVIGSVGQYAGHMAAIGWLARRRNGMVSLGWHVEPFDVLYLGIGVILQIALALLIFPLASLLGASDGGQAIGDVLSQMEGPIARVLMAGVLAVAAPVVEELLFRGILLQALLPRGRQAATVVSSLVFALFHLLGLSGDPLRSIVLILPPFFLIGIFLARVTLRRQRLGPAIFIHSGFNLLAVLVFFIPPELLERAANQ
ncbi:MAG: lysostaphin resistance A-like protein [Actinomycetota bacterium]